ncbi:hypothetical protein DDB_G0268054 [Dictyostelium discoideum AX4]|uniref:Uncharacterized protein n=1 Tax=Dictyostelium discoideum TaxID=44689 RepID=Q55FL6_DICDI|nr:hypothetical protein DDB_G0268054 [Dictyostelium discoideum AX4]EAL73480.1 hypothetical protein DDB_G0268054 [Dictyostelium discoideum AX4]|eukprot:XP_647517.1 hypothetical protein DDB_G0268054 [Dictyostelium discoideum AX4]
MEDNSVAIDNITTITNAQIMGDNDRLIIDDNVLNEFKNDISKVFNKSNEEMKKIENQHFEIFNQFLIKEKVVSKCIEKEKNLIQCLSNNKDHFLNCSDILKEFTACQEKFVKEFNINRK